MSIYSEKLAHAQIVINFRARDAPMCTSEDGLAYIYKNSASAQLLTSLNSRFLQVSHIKPYHSKSEQTLPFKFR